MMRREYVCPVNRLIDIEEETAILVVSDIPVDGETNHFDTQKKMPSIWEDSNEYQEDIWK